MDDLAFKIFKLSASGFCCTQIMLKLALDEEETKNHDLIRVAHGLCKGIGSTQKTCGVLTGGIGILGLYAGKGHEEEYTQENFSRMMDTFCEWFESEFGSTECIDLIGVTEFENGDQSYQVKCGDILVKSYMKVYEVLSEYDYEYGSRE
ncbi:DVU_1555 family C-GCAxxG-C-C protein [Marinisporobacter balticus]|uniref:C_GCAxxG_C_C family probable redox protein n=1 Tax=Marinisporobacter balticus TaxID=2018667 RepID=A0A4R2KE85_9FIRM|nr:DV_1555 family C-GCAxxG-C-C protein [Marinisporobacter balticus]TCO71823.1 C_GCAxxG_C_C family probable redox protein [Marinisporobacter balticus]